MTQVEIVKNLNKLDISEVAIMDLYSAELDDAAAVSIPDIHQIISQNKKPKNRDDE